MPLSPKPFALITGGARRVGRAVGQMLSQLGFSVGATYLSSSAEAESLAKQMGGIAIQADLTRPEEAAKRIADSVSSFTDRVDLLLHNASMYEPDSPSEPRGDSLRKMLAVHCESPLLISAALLPLLRNAKGSIITMLDIQAERPFPKYASYCASKAALWNLTLSMARDFAPDIRVNGIAPGVVEWPANYPEAEKEKYLQRVPLKRSGTPADVAATVRFLTTEATYLTGQVIRLDGGRSIV